MTTTPTTSPTTGLAKLVIDSPVGPLTLFGSSAGLAAVLWLDELPSHNPIVRDAVDVGPDDVPVLTAAAVQLTEYFAGERREFDLPLDLRGTEFQVRCWQALSTIPYGETVSYAEQADRIGNPKAVRAVGAANGRNPVSIVVPCHRVVGSNGSLTGYAAGVDTKRFLLDLEAGRRPMLD